MLDLNPKSPYRAKDVVDRCLADLMKDPPRATKLTSSCSPSRQIAGQTLWNFHLNYYNVIKLNVNLTLKCLTLYSMHSLADKVYVAVTWHYPSRWGLTCCTIVEYYESELDAKLLLGPEHFRSFLVSLSCKLNNIYYV